VAIGRAIVRKPRLFLFDEPLSNLDTALRVQMRGELARLHRQLKTTMIYVTHDQVEAMTLASRVAVFHQGHLQQVGNPLHLYERPANRFVGGFLGSPSMNFLPVRRENALLSGKGFQLPLPVSAPTTPRELLVGLRPQNLRVSSKGPFQGIVESVERMGFDGYAYLGTEDGPLVSRFDKDARVSVGDTVRVSLSEDTFHLFSADGAQALWHPEGGPAAGRP
jgi:multiple sugar transport system ATP-binding protein